MKMILLYCIFVFFLLNWRYISAAVIKKIYIYKKMGKGVSLTDAHLFCTLNLCVSASTVDEVAKL